MKDKRQPKSLIPVGSSSAPSAKSTTVGFDDDLLKIKMQLTGESLDLQTVSIVGMGGIGKTTLAQKIYDDAYIIYHFDIRAWMTVSQDCHVREILLGLLDCTKTLTNEKPGENIEQLEELLYKNLKGRRYLIVMDDVWDTKIWDGVRRLFPNDKNGSRIMLTTRLDNVAVYANSCSPFHHMHFLNEDDSWKLFCEKVFGEECCPPELEEIGRKIVENCMGLPLAVVVLGGLLSKANRTHDFWTDVAENLSSVITSNEEQYSKIFSLSYNNLPHHLQRCFIYIGVFPKGFNIRVSLLVKLWVADGLVKPMRSKSLEDVAEEYLLDLIERSLILVYELSSKGKIKTCKIHDLLRDSCVSEAQKWTSSRVSGKSLDGIREGTSVHRVTIHPHIENIRRARKLSTSLATSILDFDGYHDKSAEVFNFRLLREMQMFGAYSINLPNEKGRLVKLLYICTWSDKWPLQSIYKFENLQTLLLRNSFMFLSLDPLHLPPEIWKMSKLRHVQLDAAVNLPDPPSAEIDGQNSTIVLESLQTLSLIQNFRCTDEVLKRIPNLKKLGIYYPEEPLDWGYYCLNNLVYLHKLEALKCFFHWPSPSFLKNLNFPASLKKLTFIKGSIPWNDMTIVGSLPNLEVLKLKTYAFSGREWEPNEGEFLQLKFLLLDCIYLEHWRADSIHFPSLQRLVLKGCYDLKEIPCGIGEIPTLQSIELRRCRDSVATSAKEIQMEQLELGNDGLQVQIM
ncbi:putative disease resistance RPP13-like protein 3 [Forsythia ovata]|uniref:Disease resistance RPP13-like protein 3 n=1 Tax=Forsythia ovata TaxID=205694 RepID=A0ABD1TRW1_9LAMI